MPKSKDERAEFVGYDGAAGKISGFIIWEGGSSFEACFAVLASGGEQRRGNELRDWT